MGRFSASFMVLSLLVIPGSRLFGQHTPMIPAGSIGGYDMLLLNERVQKELKLSEEQILKVKEIIREVRQKRLPELEKLRKLSPEAGREKFVQLSKAYSDEALQNAGDVLMAEQVKRLKQIRLQQEGLRAFRDAELSKPLKLTEAQTQEIKKIEDELREKGIEVLHGGARSGFQEALAALASLRKDALQKAVELLTPEQKKVWQELSGEPFEIKFDSRILRRPPSQEKKPDDRNKK